MKPYNYFKSLYMCKISKQVKITFIGTLIFGLLSHIFVLVNVVNNYDNISATPAGVGAGVTSGRWMLQIIKMISGYRGLYNVPAFNGILTILLVAFSASIIVSLFKIKDLMHCVLIGGIIICFPTVTSTMFFMFTAPYYGLAIFLSVYAVWMTERYKYGFTVAAVCIACALGTYQAYLPLSAGLFLLLLICKCLRENLKWKRGLILGIKYLSTLILGFVIYLFVLKIMLWYCNITLDSYQGISSMGKVDIGQLPSLIKSTYYNCLSMINSDYCSLSSTYMIQKCILLMYISSFFLGIYTLFYKKRLWKERIMILFLAILLPIALNSIVIMCPDSVIYTIMLFSMVVIYLIPVVLLEISEETIVEGNKKNKQKFRWEIIYHICKWAVPICLIVVIANYIWLSNGNYMMSYYTTKQTENYLGTLVTAIKTTSGYSDDYPVAFIGKVIEDKSFNNPWESSPFHYGGSSTKLINRYSRDDWMRNYLGYRYTPATDEQLEILERDPKVAAMPYYPNSGAIKVVDKIVVVKLKNS